MSSRALTVPTIDLEPNPPPYGAVRLRQGAWEQMLANKAYHAAPKDAEPTECRAAACDREI